MSISHNEKFLKLFFTSVGAVPSLVYWAWPIAYLAIYFGIGQINLGFWPNLSASIIANVCTLGWCIKVDGRSMIRPLVNIRSYAPGRRLLITANFIFSKRKFNSVYFPIVSDMREEYFEALSQNRIWKARWVRVRGTYSFFAAIGMDRAFAFVSFFIKAWKSVN